MKTKIYDYNWKIIQKFHDETGSLKIIQEKYNISRSTINTAIKHDLIRKNIIHHKHTQDTKNKLSILRKKYLKENPDKHPWKKHNKFKSIPCEKLKIFLKENNISYVEEYSNFDRYFSIDIAFPNEKIGLEINGNQHYDRKR